MNTVSVNCTLVIGQKFNSRGWADGKPSVRVTKLAPSLEPHEIALALQLGLPASLFRKPALRATIVVPPDQAPVDLTPDIAANIAEAVRERMGITLRVEAPAEKSEGTAT